MTKDYVIIEKEQLEKYRNVYAAVKTYKKDLDDLSVLVGKIHNGDVAAEDIYNEYRDMYYLSLGGVLDVFDNDKFMIEMIEENKEKIDTFSPYELAFRDDVEFYLEEQCQEDQIYKEYLNEVIEKGEYDELINEIAEDIYLSDFWLSDIYEDIRHGTDDILRQKINDREMKKVYERCSDCCYLVKDDYDKEWYCDNYCKNCKKIDVCYEIGEKDND